MAKNVPVAMQKARSMSHGSSILEEWNATSSPSALRKIKAARRFEAAQQSRLAFGWNSTASRMDAEIRMDLQALRNRSRDLSINNPYARKFLQMCATNVVGSQGFTFQSTITDNSGQPDTMARDAVEAMFAQWSEAGNCETSGKLSFNDLCRLVAKTLARDGEVLIRRVRNSRFDFGYKLQLLDIDRLDILHNENLSNGNTVRMGVELDTFGAPVAYWLLQRHPGEYMQQDKGQQMRERVPANDIFHIYTPDRPEQTRGFPWMAASLMRLKMMDGYEEAAITAARNGASKMGFFTSPDGDARPLADGEDGDTGEFTTTAEPGTFDVIPQGYTFQQYNPEYPTQNYDIFLKECLRGIASGWGVAYNSLANNLENVNYSSIRSGVIEERDNWMAIQDTLIQQFLRGMAYDLVAASLLLGRIVMSNGSALPSGKLTKFRQHSWQGRRWQWVDPRADIEASITAIKAGLTTPQIVAAQQGVALDDVVAGLQQANAMAAAAGLPGYCVPEVTAPPPANNDQPTRDLVNILAARAAEPAPVVAPVAAPNISVQLNADALAQSARDVTEAVIAHSRDLHEQIREDIQNMPIVIPAPQVRVDAPNVTINVEPTPVTLEATIQPADVTLSMPDRRTETEIKRNAAGEMVGSVAVERNA